MENIEYLKKVLNKWPNFCRIHKNLEKAIREVLEENKQLKLKNEILKSRLNALVPKFTSNVVLVQIAKYEAYVEFARMVKLEFCDGDLYLEIEENLFIEKIDNLLKKMLGEENG